MASGGLSLDNPVMKDFMFYAIVVVFKMMAMSFATVRARRMYKVFPNLEDANQRGWTGRKVAFDCEGIERIRRNHLNDMENIIPFVLIGLCYVTTNPAPSMARMAFRIFTASRLFHTVAYQIPLPQPSRGLAFLAGFLINVYMGVSVLLRCM